MKKLILSMLLSTLTFADNYWDTDDDKPYFQQRDNLAHIAVASVASYIVSDYAMQEGFSETESWFIGLGTSLLIGVVKELSDDNFSERDLSGYAIGGAIGSSIVIYKF